MVRKVLNLWSRIKRKIWNKYLWGCYTKRRMGYVGKNVILHSPILLAGAENIYLEDDTNIYGNATILSAGGKFIMKKHSGAAQGLTVVTGNHSTITPLGKWSKDEFRKRIGDIEKDIIVEEDVWLATNVTLLSGSYIGRGATIGSGCVVRSKVPPYSIVIGNPAKIVGFKFTPQEVIEHEKILYPEKQRLPLDLLEKNYNKYFISRIKEIKEFTKL